MKTNLRTISLLLWVTQFGLSVLFPVCFFLMLGTWLRNRYDMGMWIIVVCGVIGFLTTISTARSCIHLLRRDSEEAGSQEEPPVSFNDHE